LTEFFFLTHTYICVTFFSWPSFGGIIRLNKCFYMCFNVDVITKIMCSMFLITWSQKKNPRNFPWNHFHEIFWIWIARFFFIQRSDARFNGEIWVRVIFILIYQWYILQLYVLWTLPYIIHIKKECNFFPRNSIFPAKAHLSWSHHECVVAVLL